MTDTTKKKTAKMTEVFFQKNNKIYRFLFLDFLDLAPFFADLDIVLLIPEVWGFYLLSKATFFFSS